MQYKALIRVFILSVITTLSYAASTSIHVTIPVKPGDTVFENTIALTIDNPTVKILDWHTATPSHEIFDDLSQSSKKAFQEPIDLTVQVFSEEDIPENVHIDVYYIVDNSKKAEHIVTSIPATQTVQSPEKQPEAVTTENTFPPIESKSFIGHIIETFHKVLGFIKNTLSNLLENNESVWLRLLVVFFLGVLMSFTPCIYPMIPVTVGLLQLSAQRSLFQNFLIASCYTCGIGTTFALVGLIVASGSAHFGMVLSSPFFVMGILILLIYLAFSLFDFYPLYTPRFMKHSGSVKTSSAFVSAFFFGAASGTILSPCLSPGLALVLTFVAHLSNIWLGFFLLFAFGVGSSIPLLIVGTFSSTLTFLPQAGAWMDEIKKIFGMLLLVSAYSYARILLPEWALLFISSGMLLFLGIYYARKASHTHTKKLRRYRALISVILVSSACVTAYNGFLPLRQEKGQEWITTFEMGSQTALQNNQLMFLDFGAAWCTLCHQVEKEILHNPQVQNELERFVRIKIDCTNPSDETCEPYIKQFNIKGFPAIVLYDPVKKEVVKQWQSEILDKGIEAFAQELKKY